MKLMQGNQRGFTLVEVTVAVVIMALVGLAAAMAIIQVVNAGRNSSHMSALRQVQTAGYWVSRDGVQAQVVFDEDPDTLAIDVEDNPLIEGIDILVLQRVDWYTDNVHRIHYSLQDMGSDSLKQLWRHEVIEPEEGDPTVQSTMIAQYIDGSATGCEWADAGKRTFIFEVSATVEQQTESRTYEIKPRPMG